jgi:hypothetical protein
MSFSEVGACMQMEVKCLSWPVILCVRPRSYVNSLYSCQKCHMSSCDWLRQLKKVDLESEYRQRYAQQDLNLQYFWPCVVEEQQVEFWHILENNLRDIQWTLYHVLTSLTPKYLWSPIWAFYSNVNIDCDEPVWCIVESLLFCKVVVLDTWTQIDLERLRWRLHIIQYKERMHNKYGHTKRVNTSISEEVKCYSNLALEY